MSDFTMLNRLKVNTVTIIVLVIIVILIGAYVVSISRHKTKNTHSQSIPSVTVSSIKEYIIPQKIISYGMTTSPTSLLLSAQTDAVVSAIGFKPGQRVKKGQLLFTLNVSDVGNQTDKLKAVMETSRLKYVSLQEENEGVKGTVAAYIIHKAKLQYDQDLSAFNQALSLQNVRSPINGTVSDTTLTVGSFVQGGALLANVINLTSLQLRYQLPSQVASHVKLGQKVVFYPDNSKQGFIGKVSYVSPLLNPKDYSLTLRANFAKPQSLLSNQFGKVVQTLNAHFKTLAIPQGLVQTDSKGFYVYTLNHQSVTKHYFTPGAVSKTGLIQVKSGIGVNTLIITSALSTLSPGQTVKVIAP